MSKYNKICYSIYVGEKMKKNMNSPLRYPGGKSKLYDEMKKILEYNNLIGCTYIEPFAGRSWLSSNFII